MLHRTLRIGRGIVRGSAPLSRRHAQSNTKVADESTSEYKSTVRALVSSRLFPARKVDPVPVHSMCDAYRIQQGVAQCASLRSKEGGTIKGWKVGASNQAAIDKLGLKEAFRGPLFTPTLRRSPSTVAWEELGVALFAVEAEFAFSMDRTLPPRPEPYSEDEVWAAVRSVHPAIEIAASRSPSALPLSPDTVHALVADHALHGVLVVGDGVPAGEVDRNALPSVRATIERSAPAPAGAAPGDRAVESDSGSVSAEGAGSNVLGSPLTSLTWLANALRKDGIALEAEAIVTTGAAALLTSDQVPWGKECVLEASLSGLGGGEGAAQRVRLNMPREGVRPWEIRE